MNTGIDSMTSSCVAVRPRETGDAPEQSVLQDALDAVERRMIHEALQTTRGNMAKASRMLGITERIMGLRVNKYGMDLKAYRTPL